MNTRIAKMSWLFVMALAIVGLVASGALAAGGKVTRLGKVTAYEPPAEQQSAAAIQDSDTVAMPLPTVDGLPALPADASEVINYPGPAGFEPGGKGNGKPVAGAWAPLLDKVAESEASSDDAFAPQEYGTANMPYTTTRVDVTTNIPSKYYPFRAAGKLYFKDPVTGSNYVCSASLIKRGLIVTAAHCVAKFGQNKWYSTWQYAPAKYDATEPYGRWSVTRAYAMTSYLNGTDTCYSGAPGVICTNDVAVLVVTPKSGVYPGTSTGYFGFGYNGYGFTNTGNYALINQLGYPVSHDSGLRMQRTDAQGYKSTTYVNNTYWGGRQTGGSSGGPELVNLGILPTLSGTSFGSEYAANTVVGVTSWGWTSTTVKAQGASPFLSTNILALKNTACAAYAAACL